jgi:hypothetical protein
LDSALVEGTEAETLAWLVRALEHAHARGQAKLVGYLEAVVEDVEGDYDAAKTLAACSAKLRNKTDLHGVSDERVGIVRETMQPAHGSLWLRPDTASEGQQAD